MRWISKIQSKRQNDRADAILVMSILFVPFLFLVSGFAMDLTKSVYVKQQYQIMAQDASTAATRTINTNGSIASSAPQDVVNVYRERFDGIDTSAVNSGNSNRTASQEGSFGVRNSVCKTVTLTDGTVKTAPYMVITLSGGRNDFDTVNGSSRSPIYTSENYGAPVLRTGTTYDSSVRYTTIEAEVWDTSPNLMLGMFGRPCQQLKSVVNSITFGSQADIYNYDTPTTAGAACPASNLQWTGSSSLSWSVMENSNGYRLTSTSTSGAPSGPFTTTATNFSNTALNRYEVDRAWKLEAKNSSTGGYVNCGTINGTAAPAPSCPAGSFAWSGTTAITWNAVTNASAYRVSSSQLSGVWANTGTTTSYSNTTDSTKPRTDKNTVGNTLTLQAQGLSGNWVDCGTLVSTGATATCPTWTATVTGNSSVTFKSTWTPRTSGQPAGNTFRLYVTGPGSPTSSAVAESTGTVSASGVGYAASTNYSVELRLINSSTSPATNLSCGSKTVTTAAAPFACSRGPSDVYWSNPPAGAAYYYLIITEYGDPVATYGPIYGTSYNVSVAPYESAQVQARNSSGTVLGSSYC